MFLYASAMHRLESGPHKGEPVVSLILKRNGNAYGPDILPPDKLRHGCEELTTIICDKRATKRDHEAVIDVLREGRDVMREQCPDILDRFEVAVARLVTENRDAAPQDS